MHTHHLSACAGAISIIDDSDVHIFTDGVLSWWAANGHKFPTWAKATRMVFALTPNSASAERVFSMLTSTCSATRRVARLVTTSRWH